MADMGSSTNGQAAAGRFDHFVNGSESVREPQFFSMQQAPGGVRPYQKTSVLDQLIPPVNGMSQANRDQMVLGQPHAMLGESTSTYDAGPWLRNARQASMATNDPQNRNQ